MTVHLSDFSPAPNQGGDPVLYEVENGAFDRRGLVLDAMRAVAPWAGRTIVDLGCGSGYWLQHYVGEAAEVIGVEPDETLLPLAAERDPRARVLRGSAEHIPLPDASVDVVHARFAYFFGEHCDPGLLEVRRVLRPGGTLIAVDNDLRQGDFASLLVGSYDWATESAMAATDAWWAQRGAARTEVMSDWTFDSRADLDAVLHLELDSQAVDPWLASNPDALALTYGYVLFAVGR